MRAANTMQATMRSTRSTRSALLMRAVARRALLGGCGGSHQDRVGRPSAARDHRRRRARHDAARRRAPPRRTAPPHEHDEPGRRHPRADARAPRPRPRSPNRKRHAAPKGSAAPRRWCARRATRRATPPTTTPTRPCACSSAHARGSSDGYGQQAFFFVDGRYIGTDAKEPSAHGQRGRPERHRSDARLPAVPPGDPLCCPGGGQAKVRFQLNNGKLAAARARSRRRARRPALSRR